jgi:hypothetical protein
MGRAKGVSAEVEVAGTAGFAAVFGNRRGLMDADLLQSEKPSAFAREELRRLVQSPTFSETNTALLTLLNHHQVIDERPLLDELANLLCLASARRVIGVRSPAIREFMDTCGLRTALAEQVFYDGAGVLHVCERGHELGVDDTLETACGILLRRSDMHAAARGTWKHPFSSGLTRCNVCAKTAALLPDCLESEPYPALSADAEDQLVATVSANARSYLDSALAAGTLPDEDELDSASAETLTEELTNFVVTTLCEGGAAAIARALGGDLWQRLRQAVPLERLQTQTLEREDWDDWVRIYRPSARKVDTVEYKRHRDGARTQLFNLMAEEFALKSR